MDHARQIESLRRSLRRTQIALGSLAIIGTAGAFALGFASRPEPQNGEFDEIVCREIRVVNEEGEDRIVAKVNDEGAMLVVGVDREDNPSAAMVMWSEDIVGMALLNKQSQEVGTGVAIGCTPESASIELATQAGHIIDIEQPHNSKGGMVSR